jgi:hypothetical protein
MGDDPPAFASNALAPPPLVPGTVEQGRPMEEFLSPEEKKALQKQRLGLSLSEASSLGCGFRDRFDRKAALAYNFSGDQDRLALHMSIHGPSLSDPGRLEVNNLMIRFTHKFQKPAKSENPKRKCLFPSPYQGMAGSVYNELFVRDNFTVWDELSNRGVDFK